MNLKVLVFLGAIVLTGCIHKPTAPDTMGVTLGATPPPAPPAALVSSCESTRTWHNIWVISGTIFGGAGGAGGTATTLTSDKTLQMAIGIGTVAAGIFGAISSAAAGIESDVYATDNCQQILQQAVAASAAGAHQ